jgi:spore germination cell wall hydrolase CwlJ-like protein
MHYTMVAGGNAFYEKRGRNWQPLPDEPQVAIASATPEKSAAPVTLVASAEPARLARTASVRSASAQQTYVTAAAAPSAKSARVSAEPTVVAMQEPMEEPDAARFGGTLNTRTRVIASVEDAPQEASMGFQSTPENTDAVGAMIVSQGRPLEAN